MHILAIDQGTTGTTALLFDFGAEPTRVLGRGYRELPQHFPRPGWVEHDLEEIWTSCLGAIADAAAGQRIDAIGITNQRETTGLWHADGRPAHRAIVWQDRRTVQQCQALKPYEELFRARTGLVLDPYFSGTKLAWLLSQVDSSDLRFGTIDTWLVYKLTGAHVTDATNAGRTLLFDIHRGLWDDDLLARVGNIPRALLPEVCNSAGLVGRTRAVPGLADGVPVTGIAGDQHAALFGQACVQPGSAKCTYGTGAFLLQNTGSKAVPSKHGLLTTLAWQLDGARTYALEGSAFTAGAVVQWLRDGLQLFERSADIEALAASVPDAGGVLFVPGLAGLGAPHWSPNARGLISGLTRGTTRAHIARAALEGIALQVRDLLAAMAEDAGAPLSHLRVDGGAAANDLLMQMQADLLGVEVHRPALVETTALGAAFLAAIGVGRLRLEDIAATWQCERTFRRQRAPDPAQLPAWNQAVANA
jgi:glycerol kinase